MNDRIDRGGISSTSALPGSLAEAGSGASSRPTGPAQRPPSGPTTRIRRIALATASLAALGTLGFAVLAFGGPGAAPPTQVMTAAAVTTQAPAPTEQVVVDTVYVQAPAPTAQPALVVPSKVRAQAKPPIRVVHVVVAGAGGEAEGGGDGGEDGSGGSD